MNIFNEFYYSFSPTIASLVSSSQAIAAPVRLLLYPLICTLRASSAIFHVLDFAPEMGMIVAGVFSSALLGIVFVMPSILGIRLLRKNRIKLKMFIAGSLSGRQAEE